MRKTLQVMAKVGSIPGERVSQLERYVDPRPALFAQGAGARSL
jgi:hypothetical protein